MLKAKACFPKAYVWDLSIIIFLYFLAYILLLLNSGVYWDDWTLVGQSVKGLHAIFDEGGKPINGVLHIFLMSLSPDLRIYKVIIFASHLASVVFVFLSLCRFAFISRGTRFFLVALFALLPINLQRVASITFNYSLCLSIFYCASWLLFSNCFGSRLLRFLMPLLFLVAFRTPSLLVLYAIPMGVSLGMDFAAERNEKISKRQRILNYCKSHFDLILAPLAFWGIDRVLFKPFGHYAHYREFAADRIGFSHVASFISSLGITIGHLAGSLREPFAWRGIWGVLLVGGLGAAYYQFKQANKVEGRPATRSNAVLCFFFGFLAFALGAYPYFAVRNGASESIDWSGRDHLLLSLGMSFCLVFGVKIVFSRWLRMPVLVCLLLLSLIATVRGMAAYQVDWYKQLSLIRALKSNSEIREGTTFVFVDKAEHLNAQSRVIRFYEYTGILKRAFGDESRLGVPEDRLDLLTHYRDYVESSFSYNISQYKPRGPVYRVEITSPFSNADRWRWIGLGLCCRSRLESILPSIVSIKVSQMDLRAVR